DTLWYDHREQVLDILPELVQMISWNDYGESHYITPLCESAIVPVARGYISVRRATIHAFYYITAYKSGSGDIYIEHEGTVFWYRTSVKYTGSDGGTMVGPQGNDSA
ncbi:glycoside hydrolase, partial [Trichophaea hybrida]